MIVSTGALALGAGVLGFIAGKNWQERDESAVIPAVAALYVAETGHTASDCVGVPGQGDVWVRVTCGALVYLVDHRGRIARPEGPEL